MKQLKACHVQNYSIFEKEIDGNLYLFSYLE
jgi:L-rhamnose mutarotase